MYYLPLIYLAVISLIAIILTIHDKNAARKNARRIKERTLLAISILGGSAAMLVTMHWIRHKTRHAKFMVGIPLIIIVQIAIIWFTGSTSLAVNYYNIDTDKIDGQIKLARESTRIPRIFNHPELVVITVTNEPKGA